MHKSDYTIKSRDHIYFFAVRCLIEGNIPQTYETVVDGLLKSGFDREEIIFFSGHIVADAEHGEIGVNMIDEMTPSDKRQDVLDAVTEAADHWWNLHHQGAS
ncbi:MAG: iron-containing redox enzyme family protein [Sedimenticola sp.]